MAEWQIVGTDEFFEWFVGLDTTARRALMVRVQVLREVRPRLGRPYVDTVYRRMIPLAEKLLQQQEGGRENHAELEVVEPDPG